MSAEYEIRPAGLEAAASARAALKRKRDQDEPVDIEFETKKRNQKVKSCTHNVELPPDYEDKR